MRFISVLLLLVAAVAAAPTRSPARVADEVAAAFVMGDADTVRKLAGLDEMDPWLVGGVLAARGQSDAADAYAAATGVVALQRYVAGQRGKPDRDAALLQVRAARKLAADKNFEAALEKLAEVDDSAADFASILARYHRGRILRGARKSTESVSVLRSAAERSESIGWTQSARACWRECGDSASRADDWKSA